jgi:hypothetical protein
MRPEETWKSTDARPTPASVGPRVVPVPSAPWQTAQSESQVRFGELVAAGAAGARATTASTMTGRMVSGARTHGGSHLADVAAC